MELKNEATSTPKDRYNVVYILFALGGVIHLLSGTFFVTANDYWMYKFRNTSSEEVDSYHRTDLQTRFSSSLTIAQNVGSVVFTFLALIFGQKIPTGVKLHGSLFVVLLVYVISAIFIHIDTDSWQTGFFALTMLGIAVVNGMSGIFGLSLYSVISNFPKEFVGPYLNGQGIAAIFTACLQILALAVGISTTKSALVYFWMATIMILFCLSYMLLVNRLNAFYKFHKNKQVVEKERKVMKFGEVLHASNLVWKSSCVFFFYFLTVNTVHPALTSLVVSEGAGQGEWNDVYFVPVATFLLVAVCDYLGRLVTVRFQNIANLNGTWFVLLSAIRIVIFIPLFFYCNIQPRNHLPVAFPHDYQYILIVAPFAFTNGFLLSIAVLIIPRIVPPENLEDCYQVSLMAGTLCMGALSFLGFVSVDLI